MIFFVNTMKYAETFTIDTYLDSNKLLECFYRHFTKSVN